MNLFHELTTIVASALHLLSSTSIHMIDAWCKSSVQPTKIVAECKVHMSYHLQSTRHRTINRKNACIISSANIEYTQTNQFTRYVRAIGNGMMIVWAHEGLCIPYLRLFLQIMVRMFTSVLVLNIWFEWDGGKFVCTRPLYKQSLYKLILI